MRDKLEPTVTVAVAAYQAEHFIGETLESILGQTRPADEVIVVEDGSTDGTPRVLERFAEEIRIIPQANRGCAASFNTAFRHATCDYVAECGADDVWEPNKLARQVDALTTHPEIDIAFTAARVFGDREGRWGLPAGDSSRGVLDRRTFARTIYRSNPVCPSTTLTRRSLYEDLGPFAERDQIATEDYEYWMRALRAGAVFHYDPEMLVRYRRHGSNASSNHLAMAETDLLVHRWYVELGASPWLVRTVRARDHFVVGRLLRDQGDTREARSAFLASVGLRPTPRAVAWAALLSLPERLQGTLADRLIAVKRAAAGAATIVGRHSGARAGG